MPRMKAVDRACETFEFDRRKKLVHVVDAWLNSKDLVRLLSELEK